MPTDTDVETTTLEGEDTTEQEAQEAIPAYMQRVLDGQTRLENQQQSLRRQLMSVQQRGEAPTPALLKTMANVEQLLKANQVEEQIKQLDLTDVQAEAFRKAHGNGAQSVPEPEWDEADLRAQAEQELDEHLMPKFHQVAQMLGMELTPANEEEIRQRFRDFDKHVEVTAGQITRFKDLFKFEQDMLASIAATAERMQSAPKPSARTAGKTLGEGTRPSGGNPALPTWEQAEQLAAKGKLSPEVMEKLLARG